MELKHLKKWSSIEKSLSFIKKYNRVVIRKDKNIENYMDFVFLALLDSFYKKIVIRDIPSIKVIMPNFGV